MLSEAGKQICRLGTKVTVFGAGLPELIVDERRLKGFIVPSVLTH